MVVRSLSSLALLMLAQTSMGATPNDLHLIIKYKQPNMALVALKQTANLPLQTVKPIAGGAYSAVFNTQNVNEETIINNLRKDPKIAYVVKDHIGYVKPLPDIKSIIPNVILSHDLQWDEFKKPGGIMLESAAGRADGAWSYTHGENIKPIVVGVLDTGVELNPSLVDNLLKDPNGKIAGWNFAANNHYLLDETESYHGTHVAGTIAGYGNVMQGVGNHLKILTLKIPDASGMFYESSVINAIYWAAGADVPGVPKNVYPVEVLNMSFGIDEYPGKERDYCDEALQEAITYAREHGIVIIVAAGNDNNDQHKAPAVCQGTLRIASTGPKGLRAYYSNYGPGISFAAPGGDKRFGATSGILSTVKPGSGYQGSGFDFYQGTSMAAPHAAGIAALIYAVSDIAPSAEYVEQVLYTTTHDFGYSENTNDSCLGIKSCGHGILDAQQAVKAAMAKYQVFMSTPVWPVTDNLQWQLVKSLNPSAHTDRPKLSQVNLGDIFADYGDKIYQLNQTNYKLCVVIGFDGIGCYM